MNILNGIKDPYKIIKYLAVKDKLRFMSDRTYLKLVYRARIGKKLNIDSPKSFNEKLQWLKLHDHNPLYTSLVDKAEVKEYIKEKIGAEYIIPTLEVYDSVEDIDFNGLPEQFVIKCTHDSGGYVVCSDKNLLDVEYVKLKLNKSFSNNYYWSGREWPYKNVKPRIIVEKYMKDNLSDDLTDYKFMCFNGRVKCVFTCTERFSGKGLKVTFFDRQWNKMPFERHYPSSNETISRPYNFEKMIELSEILSKGIPFVRVDFYEINKKIYFGELTFYPGNGYEEFTPEEWDYELGEWLELPEPIE